MSINYAQTERAELSNLFETLGPDAPTLCGEWATRDLAAHLIVRERRPDGAIGILAKPFAGHTEKVQSRIASKPWNELIELVRTGPPVWSPTRLSAVDKLVNTVEFFVHHEDVRRGGPDFVPRTLDAGLDDALWSALGRMGKMMTKSSPCGLTLVAPGRDPLVTKPGQSMVTMTGPVSELLMFVEGRQEQSDVQVEGPTDSVAAVRIASFGI